MKKRKLFAIITSCCLVILLCTSLILTNVIKTKNQLITRNIVVDEIGHLSYEEKVEKLNKQFSNIETSSDEENFYFSGDIDLSQINFTSTAYENCDITKKINAKLSNTEETIEISNDLISDGEVVFEENLKFSTEYDENSEQIFLIDDNGNKINLLEELNEENVEECFFLTALIATLTVKQIVAIVVVVAVATISTAYVIQNSDAIARDIDALLNGIKDGCISLWDRIKLACGKITAQRLTKAIALTDALATTLYEKVKNKKDCYLLCGTITGSAPIPIEYKLTNIQNAVNWIKKGGSVWSPFSYTAQNCITSAGYIPGGKNKTLGIYVPYEAEIHDLSKSVGFSFCHYHTLRGNTRVMFTVHSFFGLPVFNNFGKTGANLVNYN